MGAIKHAFAKPKERFTKLANEWLRDESLSFGAIGLLSHLHSHDEGFEVDMEVLARRFKTGIRAIRTYKRELVAAGYLRHEAERDALGLISGWAWVLCEPIQSDGSALLDDIQSDGSPLVDFSTSGEPSGNKKTIKRKKTNQKKTLNTAVAASSDEPVDNLPPWRQGDRLPGRTPQRLADALAALDVSWHYGPEVRYLESLPTWAAIHERVARWCGLQKARGNHGYDGGEVQEMVEDTGAIWPRGGTWAAFLAESTATCQHLQVESSGYCSACGAKVTT